MATFTYEIILDGKTQTGSLTAENEREAVASLRADGGLIIDIKQSASKQHARVGQAVDSSPHFMDKCIKSVHIEHTFEQLSVLLDEGVPIIMALGIVGRTSSVRLGRAMNAIAREIEKGSTMSEAIAREAVFVDRISMALIKVGESNGSLPEMLDYAAGLLRRRREVRSLIVEALFYPFFILLATIGVGTFISNYVMPKLIKFISDRSVELPAVTRILVNINDFVIEYGLIAVSVLALITVIALLLHYSQAYGIYTSRYLLKIPFTGKAIISYSNSVWCHTLGMLVRSGINITRALDLTAETMGNQFYHKQFQTISVMINEGQPLSICFMATALNNLSPLACSMIVVGENSGSLDRGLIHASEFNQIQLTRRVRVMGRMIEPVMLIVVGGIVAFVYLAFFMAIQSATMSIH